MTRVIHTGDTHLGYRQYHSPERRQDFLAAFRRVVDDAIDDDVDAVVHAGDLFHDRSPALPDVHGAIGILRDLRDAGIPFLAVVGNHERTRDEQWLDLFETLGLATRLGDGPTVVGDVAFYGLDFVPRSRRDDLAYDFAGHDVGRAALVAHGLFTPFNSEWDVATVLEESSVAFDAVLLGDDHHPDRAEVDGTWVTYSGSTERTSAAEREERGYNIVDFDGEVSIRRRGVETREFVTIDLDLDGGEGVDRVRERVRQEAVEGAVVIVTIEGRGDEVPAARIEEFARERGALIARVNDRREFEAPEAETVQFTDPDEAVRDRLRELGLSEAARGIDATVRDETVADSNVRDRVTEAVEAFLEEDTSAFEAAGPRSAGDGASAGEDAETSAEPTGADLQAAHGSDDEAGEDADRVDGEESGDDGSDGAESPTDGDDDGIDESGEPTDDDPTDDDPTDDDPTDDVDESGRATTMEDFL